MNSARGASPGDDDEAMMSRLWSLCALCLPACQVKATVVNSGLCCAFEC